MKKWIPFLSGLTLALCACHPDSDTLVGTWTVDKVNVQFDERRSTPELVKQIGDMERQNHIVISPDSTLCFKGYDTELQGRLTLDADNTLYCDGTAFGQWKEGEIVTRTPSPLGEIVIRYKK